MLDFHASIQIYSQATDLGLKIGSDFQRFEKGPGATHIGIFKV